jgi:hypothetical protein
MKLEQFSRQKNSQQNGIYTDYDLQFLLIIFYPETDIFGEFFFNRK